jgi:hypothetical protein
MPRVKQAVITTDNIAPPEEPGEFHVEDIQTIEPNRLALKAKEEKFMNELIQIEIEPGEKPNDPMYVDLYHNGIAQMVLRGQPQTVKRKFVYAGLMAKVVSFACDFRRQGDTEINKLTPHTNTAYRMRLVGDTNPQGGPAWWQSVARQATGIRV